MKRPSIYATAVAGFSLHATPPAHARRILEAGPEADLGALIGDLNAAYVLLKADVAGAGQEQKAIASGAKTPREAVVSAATKQVAAGDAARPGRK